MQESNPNNELLQEEFKVLVEANVEAFMQAFKIPEERAVEAYGWLIKATDKALQPSESLEFIRNMKAKSVMMLTHEEAKLGVAIGILKVKGKPFLSVANKVKRNEPCPCGSGAKAKNCCLDMLKEEDKRRLHAQNSV